MLENARLETALKRIAGAAVPVKTEEILLEYACGRVLGQDVTARLSVPPFDRSAYDGYAFLAQDTAEAGAASPAVLRILEEIPAGATPNACVLPGTAVKILTGAPLPAGADAVCKHEETQFNAAEVRIFSAYRHGDNVIYAGEDVKKGALLLKKGTRLDPAALGAMAGQGFKTVSVYQKPRVGVISTGDELTEPGEALAAGRIYNSNRYTLAAAAMQAGAEAVYFGIAHDTAQAVADAVKKALESCDMVLLSGGVAVGDYDKTPEALALAGAEILIRRIDLRPGGACVYGVRGNKLICGLSGSPAAALSNFSLVCLPALRRIAGLADYGHRFVDMALSEPYGKKSPVTRLLRGRAAIADGRLCLRILGGQGNTVISGMIGVNAIAIVPAGSDALPKGAVLKGILL